MGSLITVAAVPQFAPGTYKGVLRSLTEKTIELSAGAAAKQGKTPGEKVNIYEWEFDCFDITNGERLVDEDTGEDIIAKTATSQASGPKSKLYSFLVALVGPAGVAPGTGYDPEDLVGKSALISVVADEGGYPKVESMQAMPRATNRSRAAAAPAPVAEAAATDDDLPF
jgi:hypothetical protein